MVKSQGIWIFVLMCVMAEAILGLINVITCLKNSFDDTENVLADIRIRTVRIVTFIDFFFLSRCLREE